MGSAVITVLTLCFAILVGRVIFEVAFGVVVAVLLLIIIEQRLRSGEVDLTRKRR